MATANALQVVEGVRGVVLGCAEYGFRCAYASIKDLTIAGLLFRCVDTLVQGGEKIFKINLKHLQPMLVGSEALAQFSTFPKTFSKISPFTSGKVFSTETNNGALNMPNFLGTVFRGVDQVLSCTTLLEKYNIMRLGTTGLLCSRIVGLSVKVLQTGLKRLGVCFDIMALAAKVITQGKVESGDIARLLGNVVTFMFTTAAGPLALGISMLTGGALCVYGAAKTEELPDLAPHCKNIVQGTLGLVVPVIATVAPHAMKIKEGVVTGTLVALHFLKDKVGEIYRSTLACAIHVQGVCSQKFQEFLIFQREVRVKTIQYAKELGDGIASALGLTSSSFV